MKLHRDWKKIARHSINFRIVAVAAFFTGLEAFVPYLPALISIDPFWMALLTPAILVLALVARLVAQKTLSGDDDADQ